MIRDISITLICFITGGWQVLGRSEFKQLLRWRLQVKKAMAAEIDGADGDAKKAKKGAGEVHLSIACLVSVDQGSSHHLCPTALDNLI